MRGNFQETAPRKTAKNTVKHHDGGVSTLDGGVGLVVANHRGGGEISVVVTTRKIITLITGARCLFIVSAE